MKIATYNANSIRARTERVREWLERERPDVLCIQETKVQDADFPVAPFEQSGYHVVYRGQKAHAGVAIASRAAPQQVAWGIDDGGPPDEARLIRARIDGLTVVNTYVPQGRNPDSEHFRYKLEWLQRLKRLFARDYTPRKHLVWCGDLNVAPAEIDVHDPKRLARHVDFHPQARAALDTLRRWGFVDVFRALHPDEPGHYTFWDYRVPRSLERGLGWRVDHILATRVIANKARAAWIDVEARRRPKPSDHTFLVVELDR
jgi:exodeoxyribonuclease-3